MSQDKWAIKATRVLLVLLVLLGPEGNQDHRVKLETLGHKDYMDLQDQRGFRETSVCQAPMAHLDRRVYRAQEDPRALQGQKEYRVMKAHLAHLAALAHLGDLEGKDMRVNLDPMDYLEKKGTLEVLEKLDHRVQLA